MSLTAPVSEWSREELKLALGEGSVLLVDVREPHEFAMGRIPGSFNLPLSSFDADALPDPEGRDVVFSCAAGIRSLRAIEVAQGAGHAHSAHYPGGFKDWVMAGEDVETG